MKNNMNAFGVLATVISLLGCAHNSMADYASAIAKDGSFAADDALFSVNEKDYPVFALIGDTPKQDPEAGAYKGQPEWTTDILPSDRWKITRVVRGQYLAYSVTYEMRFCKRQLGSRSKTFANRCEGSGQKYANEYKYIYIRQDGGVYAWQFVNNKDRAPFEKTLFRVKQRGDWSGQPWFKCIERCDKLVNMK